MRSYFFILISYSYFANNNNTIKQPAQPKKKVVAQKQVTTKKPSLFTTLIQSITKPKAKPYIAIPKKYKAPIRYKKHTMAVGEGLWQVATKERIERKYMEEWMQLVVKKNKLHIKDSNDDYVLRASEKIWIPR